MKHTMNQQAHEKDVMEIIWRLSRSVRRKQKENRDEQHPPRSVMRVLRLLEERETMRSGDVAMSLGIRPGSVTQTLAKMEAKGLIKKERDATDARIVNLSMTDKGKENLDSSRRHFEERRKQMNAVLSPEERVAFIASAEKLIAFFEEASQ